MNKKTNKYDLKKIDSYVNEIFTTIIIEYIFNLNNNGILDKDEISKKLDEYIQNFIQYSDLKNIANIKDVNIINKMKEQIIKNNLLFLEELKFIENKNNEIKIHPKLLSSYKKYNSNKTFKDYFIEELQNKLIEDLYSNELFLLTPSAGKLEELKLQRAILKEKFLSEERIEKYLVDDYIIKDPLLEQKLIEIKNNFNSIEEIKKELKLILLKNKSLKTKSLNYSSLNFLKWTVSAELNLTEYINIFKENNINSGRTLVLDKYDQLKLVSKLLDEKDLIERLKKEFKQNLNQLNHFEIEKLPEILTDDYILGVVKKNYFGNYVDFSANLLGMELDPIPYEEMENFETIVNNMKSKISKMEINKTEKIVFVIDALDMDGRSCETISDIFKNIIQKNYGIDPEQIIITPSINPKNDERGFNLTTVKSLFKAGLINESESITFITADNGINNIGSIRAIKKFTEKYNIKNDFIITDHHVLNNFEILDEPNVLVLDQELESNYHLFEGYNSCGAYLLKELFNVVINDSKKISQKNKLKITKQLNTLGLIANKADLVPAKERIPTDKEIGNSINRMNAIFSSSNLYVLAGKYADGDVSKEYAVKEIKNLYSLENDKVSEEILNKLVYILRKTNALYQVFENVIFDENKNIDENEITSRIISPNELKCISPTGDPSVYKLIKMKLNELSLDFKNEINFMIFNEVEQLIKNVKGLEQSLLKYKSSSIDIENMEIDVIDYKNIIIFNIASLSDSSNQIINDIFYNDGSLNTDNMFNEELNRKAWNKIFKLNPNMPKNIADKPVVVVGAYDKQTGAFKGSIRVKGSDMSSIEVFNYYKKLDLVNIMGHANAAGIELFFEDKINSVSGLIASLDKVGSKINRSLGQKKNKYGQQLIHLLDDTKYLGMFTQIENISLLSASPQQHHFQLSIKASELVFNNSNNLKNNKYNVLDNHSEEIQDGWYIAPILFNPEVNVLISASDLANTKKSDYFNISYMNNGSFMISGITTKKELENHPNVKKLEMYPRTLIENEMEKDIIEKVDEHTVIYKFEDILRKTKYYELEEDNRKIEKHLEFLKLMVKKYEKMLITDIETTGLGRLEKITNIGFAGLYLNEKDELELEVNHMLINVEGVPNSIMNLTDIYREDLEEKGISIDEAKKLSASILLRYKDALLTAHNGFNFDFRVLEGIIDIDNYFDNLLDSMDLVRSNKVAMDNDKNFKIEYKGKVFPAIFSELNPNFKNGLNDFFESDTDTRWLSVAGDRMLIKENNKIYYFDKKTNIKEELEKEEIKIKPYSLRAKSAVQRLGELQIVNAIRNNIEEPEFIKKNVGKNILNDILEKNDISIENKDKVAEIVSFLLKNIDLSLSKDFNIEILFKELEESPKIKEMMSKVLILDEDNSDFKKNIISLYENIEVEYKNEILQNENPLLIYKYFNVDELLHSIEIYNPEIENEENKNKILKFTNMRNIDVDKFISSIEPFKELLKGMNETHNNTANVYSDHVQEFLFLVVKTMIDNLPDHYTAEDIFQLYEENIKTMKSKYYFYKNLSEEYKPIGFNKFMFKQLLQQLETFTPENESVYKRLKDLSEILYKGKILIEVNNRAYEIEYPHIKLNDVADILIGKKEYNSDVINNFLIIVKHLENIISLKQQQEIIDIHFSEESCDINFNKALENNKNGVGKDKDGQPKVLIKYLDNINFLNPHDLKNKINEAKKKKDSYLLIQRLEDEIELETDESKIAGKKSTIMDIYESLEDVTLKTKVATKIKKLDTIIKHLGNNLLYFNSQEHFELLKDNLQLKMNQLKIKRTDIVELDVRTKDITKELITKNYFKKGVFIDLDDENKIDIIQKFLNYKSFEYKDKEIKIPKTIEEFLNNDYDLIEIKVIQEEVLEVLNNPNSIKKGNTGGNRLDLYKFVLETAQKDMKIDPKLDEIINKKTLDKANEVLEGEIVLNR